MDNVLVARNRFALLSDDEPKDVANKEDKPQSTKPRNFNEDRPNRPNRDLPPRLQERRQEEVGWTLISRRGRDEGFRGGRGEGFRGGRGEGFRGGRGEGFRGGRGGRGGEGAERGRLGPRGRGGNARDGNRQVFDRHSGSVKTETKAMEKPQGGEAHNSGTLKDYTKGTDDTAVSTPAAAAAAAEGTPAEDVENQKLESAIETGDAHPTEQEPIEMTLDEWKAKQNKERRASTFKLRQAGEGCDVQQWKQTFILKKREVELESESKEKDDVDNSHKMNALKIGFNFSYSNRGSSGERGGRGGRGGSRGGMERGGRGGSRGGMERGGRGRGGRGGPAGPNAGRGGRQAPQLPTFVESDFPALGGH